MTNGDKFSSDLGDPTTHIPPYMKTSPRYYAPNNVVTLQICDFRQPLSAVKGYPTS